MDMPQLCLGDQIDGSVQDCSNSSALAIELPQSCTKWSSWSISLVQWNLSVTTTSMIKLITGDLFSNVF